MKRADVWPKAVAFHFRHSERAGAVPWTPSNDESLLWEFAPGQGVVALYNVRDWAAYSFHKTASGALRFRTLDVDGNLSQFRKAADRALKLTKSGGASAAAALAKLGLSTREIGSIVGVSHETARTLSKEPRR